MKANPLFKPVNNLYVRIALFIIALVLCTWSGLLFAAGAMGQGGDAAWKIGLPVLLAGVLLLLKARRPKAAP